MGFFSKAWDSFKSAVHKVTDSIKTIVKESLKGHFGKALEAYGQLYVDTVLTGGDTVEKIMHELGIKDETVTSGDFNLTFVKEDKIGERKDKDTGTITGHPYIDNGYTPRRDLLVKCSLQSTDFIDEYHKLYQGGDRFSYANTVAYAKKYYKNGLPEVSVGLENAGYTEASMIAEVVRVYGSAYSTANVATANVQIKESLLYHTVPATVATLLDIATKHPLDLYTNTLEYNGTTHRVYLAGIHPNSAGTSIDVDVVFIKDSDDTDSHSYRYTYAVQKEKVYVVAAISAGGKFTGIVDYVLSLDKARLVKDVNTNNYEAAPVLLIRENKVWLAPKPNREDFLKASASAALKELYRDHRLGAAMGFDVDSIMEQLDTTGDPTTLQTSALTLMASIESTNYHVQYYLYAYFKWLGSKVSHDSSKYLYYGYGEATKITLDYVYTAAHTVTSGPGKNAHTYRVPASSKWVLTYTGTNNNFTIHTGGVNQFTTADLTGSLSSNHFESASGSHPNYAYTGRTSSQYVHTNPLTVSESDILALISVINERRKLVKNPPKPWSMDNGGGWRDRYKDTGLVKALIPAGSPITNHQNVTNFKEGPFNFNYNMQYIVEHSVKTTTRAKKTYIEIPQLTGLRAASLVIRKYVGGSYDYKELEIRGFNQNCFVFIKGTSEVHLSVASRKNKNMCVPIIKKVLHTLPYPVQEAVLSRSPCIVTIAGTFQDLRYYQTKAFSNLVQGIMIMVAIVSMNPSAMQAGDFLLLAVKRLAAMKATEFLFDKLIDEFGDDTGIGVALAILKGIAMVAVGNGTAAGGSFTLTGSDLLDVVSSVSQSYQGYLKDRLEVLGEEAAAIHANAMEEQKKAEDIREEVEGINANLAVAGMYAKWMVDNPPTGEDSDAFYARAFMDTTKAAMSLETLIS